MINVLANIHIPSSSKICVTDFGRTEDFELNYDYVEPFDQFLNKSSQKKHFDALFLFYPEYNAIPPLIEEADIPLIAFVSDWNLGFYPLKASLSRFDLIICDKIGLDVLPKIAEGVPVLHWNMYGYMPEQYKNIQRSNNGDDVLFIGNIVPTIQKERAAYLRRVATMNDRIKSRIATNIRGSDYVNALASSKVIFNRSIRSEANMRVFESLAVDKMILIEEDNNEIRDYFEPGRDCVVYNNENLEDVLV
ncbi:MAG: hypothetical protein JNL74_03020, partial [Fibrobacteres bacterium]|nr:hypothetical protein [Fibrobacterota bacterium]